MYDSDKKGVKYNDQLLNPKLSHRKKLLNTI